LVPQIVRLQGEKQFPSGVNHKGEKVTQAQPIFQDLKVNTNVTLADGERMLLFVGKPMLPGGQMELFIVGAKALPLPK
jgi:hypothetical protein